MANNPALFHTGRVPQTIFMQGNSVLYFADDRLLQMPVDNGLKLYRNKEDKTLGNPPLYTMNLSIFFNEKDKCLMFGYSDMNNGGQVINGLRLVPIKTSTNPSITTLDPVSLLVDFNVTYKPENNELDLWYWQGEVDEDAETIGGGGTTLPVKYLYHAKGKIELFYVTGGFIKDSSIEPEAIAKECFMWVPLFEMPTLVKTFIIPQVGPAGTFVPMVDFWYYKQKSLPPDPLNYIYWASFNPYPGPYLDFGYIEADFSLVDPVCFLSPFSLRFATFLSVPVNPPGGSSLTLDIGVCWMDYPFAFPVFINTSCGIAEVPPNTYSNCVVDGSGTTWCFYQTPIPGAILKRPIITCP